MKKEIIKYYFHTKILYLKNMLIDIITNIYYVLFLQNVAYLTNNIVYCIFSIICIDKFKNTSINMQFS